MVSTAVTGAGLGMVILAPVASRLLDIYDWRVSYMIFGAIMVVGASIGGALLIKDPESAGTYPDGIKPTEEEMKSGLILWPVLSDGRLRQQQLTATSGFI